MKFGVRECANIVFRAKQPIRIGTATFQAGQPVLYIDSATTSSLEQATTTVYAQGGRGNARLLSWEGEKTLTFSFTDALLSPIGFAILSGAGLFKRGNGNDKHPTDSSLDEVNDLVHFHMTSGANLNISTKTVTVNEESTTVTVGEIDLRSAVAEFGAAAKVCVEDAPIYIMEIESDGSLTGRVYNGQLEVKNNKIILTSPKIDLDDATENAAVMVDYYIDLPGEHVWEADITPETFGGNYYVEADTLFRDQHTGKDLPANLTFPSVKLQSNFTMTFAGSGDPSTFDFTMDAFPDYTYFDRKKKVLCALQIVDSIALGAESASAQAEDPVMYHNFTREDAEAAAHDSNDTNVEKGANVTSFAWKTQYSGNADQYNVPELAVGDTISFGNFVDIFEGTKETKLSDYNPEFIAVYGADATANVEAKGEYVDISADGYIVAKKATESNKGVFIKATLPQMSGNNDLVLKLTITDVVG